MLRNSSHLQQWILTKNVKQQFSHGSFAHLYLQEDMNLNEERKAPLRNKDLTTKREMVVQYVSATAKSVSRKPPPLHLKTGQLICLASSAVFNSNLHASASVCPSQSAYKASFIKSFKMPSKMAKNLNQNVLHISQLLGNLKHDAVFTVNQ